GRTLFFFQEEAGIRVGHVTGVQACALPISPARSRRKYSTARKGLVLEGGDVLPPVPRRGNFRIRLHPGQRQADQLGVGRVVFQEIGRASCREKVEIWLVGASAEKREHDYVR